MTRNASSPIMFFNTEPALHCQSMERYTLELSAKFQTRPIELPAAGAMSSLSGERL